jgi:type IV secretory pathway VirD2 relaxase
MTSHDDDIRVRPGRIRDSGRRARPKTFISQVLNAAQKAGHVGVRSGRADKEKGRSSFGRGRGISAEAWVLSNRRRVIVKARVVRHKGRAFRSAPLTAHLAYLKREGVTRDDNDARMFNGSEDHADGAAFAERCRDDRHHFRFIISPEDASELADVKAFARDLVGQMERDLGTRLDWIGIDHWNTDNPHVHILVRGRGEDGDDLVISRDYIGHGLRARAEELVGVELGQKPEHQVRAALERDVTAERWTKLDRAIRSHANDFGLVDLRPSGVSGSEQSPELRRLMIGRLLKLERMGLATAAGTARWTVAADAEQTLRQIGERADVIMTMHAAFTKDRRDRAVTDFIVHDKSQTPTVPGRLVGKGLHDELTGEAYVIIDGVDGRAHYVRFPGTEALEHSPPIGGVVEVRRLEADGDRQPMAVLSLRSDFAIPEQVTANGATWLDHQLVGRQPATLAHGGFGQEARDALDARVEYLVSEGFAKRQGQRVIFARNLLKTLRQRELSETQTRIGVETGLIHRPLAEGEHVTGTYRRRLTLASGRFAMIDDGLGFQLVPWRPALERQLGRQVSGIATASGIDWSFDRKRGLGIS